MLIYLRHRLDRLDITIRSTSFLQFQVGERVLLDVKDLKLPEYILEKLDSKSIVSNIHREWGAASAFVGVPQQR